MDGVMVVVTVFTLLVVVNRLMSMRSWRVRTPEIPRIRLNPIPMSPACRPVHFSQP